MKRLAIPFAAAMLLAGASLAPAQNPGQGKGKNQDVTIKASANPTLFRAPVTLDGRVKNVKDPITVVLQKRKAATDPYTDVASMTTSATGDYAFIRRPRRTLLFRVLARTTPETASQDLALQVRPRVRLRLGRTTVAAGRRVAFKGRVKPQHDGSRLHLQRKENGVWALVRQIRLRDAGPGRKYSKYRRRVRVPSTGTYRTVLPAHADHAEGISPERTVTTR